MNSRHEHQQQSLNGGSAVRTNQGVHRTFIAQFPTPFEIRRVEVKPVDGDAGFRIKELEPLTF
jgi:hypothetical protein